MTARDPIAAAISREAHAEIWAPTRLAIWRERSRERLRMVPPHTDCEALPMSLEALYEARRDGRAFSWACALRERLAAQDWCVSRAFRRSEQ